MVISINTSTQGISEYDISNVVDLVNVSGTVYYVTPSGIYYFDEESTESVTSYFQTGEVRFGDNSPKRFPYIEISCDNADAEITPITVIGINEVAGVSPTKHTDNVLGFRLPNHKQANLVLKVQGISDEVYSLFDTNILAIDTLVKK